MTRNITQIATALSIAVLLTLGTGCGGPETRQERAQTRAEDRSTTADEEAAQAAEAQDILDNHSIESIGNANDIVDETPVAETPTE